MKAVKFLLNDFKSASRDKREIAVMQDLGMDVTVLYPFHDGEQLACGNYKFQRLDKIWLDKNQPSLLRKLYIIHNEFSIIRQVRKLETDVISCHDLSALRIAWLANVGKVNKAKLVYDSHEFELGRNTDGKRGVLASKIIKEEERLLMKRCAFSIMVNDSIADEVQRIHKLKNRPVVVRNAAPLWERDDSSCAEVRKEFCKALNVPESTFLIMYHGGVMQNRGVENMLRALALKQDIAGVVLGDGEEKYVAGLKDMAQNLGVADRVLFHPAVPVNILKNYVGAVDCGLVTVPNACMSYYYMLPNKFFENIQSETPVIGSDFPEIHRLVSKYDIGLLCDPANPEDIAAKIEKMKSDKEFYVRCKANTKLAKQELCWENERKALIEAYKKLVE